MPGVEGILWRLGFVLPISYIELYSFAEISDLPMLFEMENR
jgi:hypothetical protein